MSRNNVICWFRCAIFGLVIACGMLASGQAPSSGNAISAPDLGISFVEGSSSQVIVERDGTKYIVDLATHQIHPANNAGQPVIAASTAQTVAGPAQSATAQPGPVNSVKSNIYKAGDDLLFNVPTGRRVERHSLSVNFTHRFPYEAAFT